MKILPCPFCGKQPKEGSTRRGNQWVTGRQVIIVELDKSKHNIFWLECCIASTKHLKNKDDVIKQWNTRVPIAQQQQKTKEQDK